MSTKPEERKTQVEIDGADSCPVPSVSEPINAYLSYVDLMPAEFQEDYIDALIICSPEDGQSAGNFKNHLADDVCYRYAGTVMKPKVKLFDRIREADSETLEKMLDHTTYTFLFLTKSFCEEQWTCVILQACLKKMLSDADKRWSVIPVHTELVNGRDYKVPLLLEPVKPIEYLRKDQFYKEAIIHMFCKRASERLKREVALNKRRQIFYYENRERLIAMKNSKAENHTQDMAGTVAVGHIEVDGGGGPRNLSERFQRSCRIEVDSPVAASQVSRSSVSQVSRSRIEERNNDVKLSSLSSSDTNSENPSSAMKSSSPPLPKGASAVSSKLIQDYNKCDNGSSISDPSSTSVCPSEGDLSTSNNSSPVSWSREDDRSSKLRENPSSSLVFSSPCGPAPPGGIAPLSLNLSPDANNCDSGNSSGSPSSKRGYPTDTVHQHAGSESDLNRSKNSRPTIVQHIHIHGANNIIIGDNGQIMLEREQESNE